jgi:hypothetical protein
VAHVHAGGHDVVLDVQASELRATSDLPPYQQLEHEGVP